MNLKSSHLIRTTQNNYFKEFEIDLKSCHLITTELEEGIISPDEWIRKMNDIFQEQFNNLKNLISLTDSTTSVSEIKEFWESGLDIKLSLKYKYKPNILPDNLCIDGEVLFNEIQLLSDSPKIVLAMKGIILATIDQFLNNKILAAYSFKMFNMTDKKNKKDASTIYFTIKEALNFKTKEQPLETDSFRKYTNTKSYNLLYSSMAEVLHKNLAIAGTDKYQSEIVSNELLSSLDFKQLNKYEIILIKNLLNLISVKDNSINTKLEILFPIIFLTCPSIKKSCEWTQNDELKSYYTNERDKKIKILLSRLR